MNPSKCKWKMQLSKIPQVTILNNEDYKSLKKTQYKPNRRSSRQERSYKRNSEINDIEFPLGGIYIGRLSLNEGFQISFTPNISLGRGRELLGEVYLTNVNFPTSDVATCNYY